MKFVSVLVEGQTEEAFVYDILQPFMFSIGDVYLNPVVLKTRRSAAGPDYKGGVTSFGQVEEHIRSLLNDTSTVLVTTMLDFYGLHGKGFPGWDQRSGNCYEQAEQVERAIEAYFASQRFAAYLSLHEFEALLFTDPQSIARQFPHMKKLQLTLEAILKQNGTAEHINLDNPPSKRIQTLVTGYSKINDGAAIASRIGLEVMRKACPHFNDWVTMLEGLAAPAD